MDLVDKERAEPILTPLLGIGAWLLVGSFYFFGFFCGRPRRVRQFLVILFLFCNELTWES